MTGSLQIKKDKYYMVINITDAGGKRKPKWISTGFAVKGNKKRAELMLRETLREYEKQERARLPGGDILFSEWVKLWLEEAKRRVEINKMDIITYQGYEENASNHIIPYFDSLGNTVAETTQAVLQAYIDEKRANGRKNGKGGLSSNSLRHHKLVLNQALAFAVKSKIISENPCKGVELPEQEDREIHYYNREQLERMFTALCDEPLYPLIRVAALYGLRRSELCGLQWDSVNFTDNTLAIKHTVVHLQTVVAKDKTKSKSSRRTFPLLGDTRELLLRLQMQEQENRRLFAGEYIESPYIFKWPNGKPLDPSYVSRKFVQLIKKHGLDEITLHGLRHSCASLLIAQGYNLKIVQDWLGHADISLTANIYGHLDLSLKRSVGDAIAGIFG